MGNASDAAAVGKSWRSTWLSHYGGAGIAGLLVIGYGFALARPMTARIARLQRQIVELEAERTGPPPDRYRAKSDAESRTAGDDGFKARHLLPKISMLARRSGLKVRTLRQSPAKDAGDEREVRIVAAGAFSALIGFLDDVARTLPKARFEEIALRQHPDVSDLELESVLRTHIEKSAATVDDREEGPS
jgi:hypothetical protein